MKVRTKKHLSTGSSVEFNTHGMGEVIVYFDEGDASSMFISEMDVFIEAKNVWVDMRQAFKDKDLIPNNANTMFDEPKTQKDKDRGYYG